MNNTHISGVMAVISAWSDNLAFFPRDPDAQAEIGARVAVWLAPESQGLAQLLWLREAVLTQMPQWKGIEALRILFASRFRLPAGIEQWHPERGTYYLDAREARKLLEAPMERLPPRADDEPFNAATFLKETIDSYRRVWVTPANHRWLRSEADAVLSRRLVEPAAITEPEYPCGICHGMGMDSDAYCDCPHGEARRRLDSRRSVEVKA